MDRPLDARLAKVLADLEARGLRRSLDADLAAGLIDFRSNDTLGLARNAAVASAAASAARAFGAGGRAARLLGGGALDARAEDAAAAWIGTDAALLFPSGWQANVGVVCALAGRGDAIVSDRLNHASLVDAARLSRARVEIVRHSDLDAFADALVATRGARRRLVVVESVFGMDGDAAPLAELHALCERHDADLVVDEAHAAGIVGPRGAGLVAALSGDGWPRLAARVVTGGKALGVAGAFVVGSRLLREVLINRARSFVFTTAPAPAVSGALVEAIERASRADAERTHVASLALALAERLGLPAPAGAIVPLQVGTPHAALGIAAECRAAGFSVAAVRPPTVPDGTSRLRVTCHAFNRTDEVARLGEVLAASTRANGRFAAAAAIASRRRPIVVVGTDTGVGKTVVSAILLHAARRVGDARYWKPVQTGDESDTREVLRLAAAPWDAARPPLHEFPLPASPHTAAAAAGTAIDPEHALDALERHARFDAPLIVELAGGLLVPYTLDFTQADLLARAGAATVLVARSGLGTLNHTALTLEALARRAIVPRLLFLVGEPHPQNSATLSALAPSVRVVEVPRFEPLSDSAIARFVDAIDLSGAFDR